MSLPNHLVQSDFHTSPWKRSLSFLSAKNANAAPNDRIIGWYNPRAAATNYPSAIALRANKTNMPEIFILLIINIMIT